MKIKSIGTICLRTGWLDVYNTDKRQCLCNGAALYVIPESVPRMTADKWTLLFSPGAGQMKKLMMRDMDAKNLGVSLADYEEGEVIAGRAPLMVEDHGLRMLGLISENGIGYINADLLAPLADEEEYEFYERRDKDGDTYYIARNGMYLLAVIMPLKVRSSFCGNLEQLYELTIKKLIAGQNKTEKGGKEENEE